MKRHGKPEAMSSEAQAMRRPGMARVRARIQPVASKRIGRSAEDTNRASRRTCRNCVFCVSNMILWMRTLLSGFPIGGLCANHPDTPGQLRPIPRGGPCRNFRLKREPPLRVDPPQPPNDKVRYIPLTRGLHAIVDADDYEWLMQYKWYAGRPPSQKTFYACRNVPGRGIMLMHRQIMQPPKGMVVDHINGNGLDNRRCNLRICTQAQNSYNCPSRAGAKSRFRGVTPRGDKWEAKIQHKGQVYNLGLFDNEIEAAKARDRKAIELFGEYAWLNLPPGSPQETEK